MTAYADLDISIIDEVATRAQPYHHRGAGRRPPPRGYRAGGGYVQPRRASLLGLYFD